MPKFHRLKATVRDRATTWRLEVGRGEEAGALPHAAPVTARAATATPVRARASGFRSVVLGVVAGCTIPFGWKRMILLSLPARPSGRQ
jgi:hypothetical protein